MREGFCYLLGLLTGAVLCFGAMNLAMQNQGLRIMKAGEPGQILQADKNGKPEWITPHD